MSEDVIGISRRGLLVGLTALMGSSMASAALKGALDFSTSKPAKSLSPDQLKMVELMADIIIPDTDTPGAAKANVHGFIDHMLTKFFPQETGLQFIEGLEHFDQKSGGFLSLTPSQQYAAVEAEDETLGSNRFYGMFKGLVVAGYYTSEIGGAEELTYDPVPGPYQELPLSDVERQWST